MKKPESPRRARRRAMLIKLLDEFGGPAQVARETGTPKSHFSALVAGERGLGDALAAKLARLARAFLRLGWAQQCFRR